MPRSTSGGVLQKELLDTIRDLRGTIDSLQATINDLRKELSESREREQLARQEIELMKKRFFGRSSEKHITPSEGQLDFFNETEMEADRQPEEEFPYEESSEKQEKKRKPRTLRREMFKGVPVEEEIIELPEEEKICGVCGSRLEAVGQRVIRETLKFIPARLTVVRTIAKVNSASTRIATHTPPSPVVRLAPRFPVLSSRNDSLKISDRSALPPIAPIICEAI